MQKKDIYIKPLVYADREWKRINDYLYNLLPQEQIDTVFNYRYCDIEPDFLGFVDTYYYLSKLIPTSWTVIDLGCSYNAQCYFFQKHNKYIAVDFDAGVHRCFHTSNCELVKSSIQDFIANLSNHWELSKTFAICNYVPNDEARKLVTQTFTNCYCFYPA